MCSSILRPVRGILFSRGRTFEHICSRNQNRSAHFAGIWRCLQIILVAQKLNEKPSKISFIMVANPDYCNLRKDCNNKAGRDYLCGVLQLQGSAKLFHSKAQKIILTIGLKE